MHSLNLMMQNKYSFEYIFWCATSIFLGEVAYFLNIKKIAVLVSGQILSVVNREIKCDIEAPSCISAWHYENEGACRAIVKHLCT